LHHVALLDDLAVLQPEDVDAGVASRLQTRAAES
jgi:hypothetical protein